MLYPHGAFLPANSAPQCSMSRDVPPELQGVSVKDLVKAIGESRANGNGATPPRTPPATPKRLSRSSSPRAGGVGASGSSTMISASGTSPRQISRSSSPVPIPGEDTIQDNLKNRTELPINTS